MAQYLPLFRPGQTVTFDATSDVTGGRAVQVGSADRSVAPAAAGSTSYVGIAGHDAAAGEKVTVEIGGPVHLLTASGTVGPLTWAAIAAGQRVATETTPPASPTPTPTAATTTVATPTYVLPEGAAARDVALVFALAQVGKQYVLGGNGPDVFDCSGLVQQAYLTAGVRLPRLASQQRYAGTEVTLDQLLPGDLLYYQDGSSPRNGHISMYAGNGLVVEAANPRRGVRVRTLDEAWYADRFVSAIRIG